MPLPNKVLYADAETYYDTEYSLTRLSYKQYVTDERFKVHGWSLALDDGPVVWATPEEAAHFFANVSLHDVHVAGWNLAFDGTILTHHYGVKPKGWIDGMGMSRAILGTRIKSHSLDSVGKAMGLGGKTFEGAALASVKGVRDPSPAQMAALAQYGIDDTILTRQIITMLARLFPDGEYPVLSWTIDMVTDQRLIINPEPLARLEAEEIQKKAEAVARAGVPKTRLSSNQQFADLLRELGVEPPTKKSKTTGKQTYAFAKNDEEFVDLLDHPDDRVHDVVAARFAVKSTIKESRAHRMRELSANGPLPIQINYAGAMQTHRFSGGGSINVQNFTRGSLLRAAVEAPPGFVVVVADLSQIELRGNSLASGQTDILDTLLSPGGDVYLNFAKSIYDDPTLDKYNNPQERTVGKIAELSLGYYAGPPTYKAMLRAQAGIRISMSEALRIVRLYRNTHGMIAGAWRIYGKWIEIMARGEVPYMDHPINLPVELCKDGFVLPSGLFVGYPGLVRYNFTTQEEVPLYYNPAKGEQVGYAYSNERRPGARGKLHAGVLNNNLIQSVCRDINMMAAVRIIEGLRDYDDQAKAVMSVHDETVVVAREDRAEAVKNFMLSEMKKRPAFWPDLPVDAEGSYGKTYADAK